MRVRAALPSVVCALLVSTSLPAQEPKTVATRLRAAGATPLYASLVEAVIDVAADDGLPTDPLFAKALEGWAKHDQVALTEVITALTAVRDQLAAGRDALRDAGLAAPSDRAIIAAGHALGRGMAPVDVTGVAKAAGEPALVPDALRVASSLIALGVPPSAARDAVREVLAHGPGQETRLFLLALPALYLHP